ncbi:uncharacterized protein LOC123896083 [Trifolium pratense]|uniref:uncharacterized protein LOC123896083 n=1 Tax=Trifolium pratense TaxID=57577 RepID=UPI001E693B40|nr:uncharacterized protein LOC123896083 [Trifolium pratense]
MLRGCRWVAGDGSNISVMGSPWIRGQQEKWIHSPQQQSTYNIYVNDLLVEGEKKWNVAKIQSLFSPDMAEAIMDVPLFPMINNDKLIWDGDKNGVYTVRVGYKLVMTELLKRDSSYVNDFIFDVCSTENSFIAGRAIMLMWCIWQNRNDMVWNNHTIDAYQLGQQAFSMWKDWNASGEFLKAQTKWINAKLSTIEGEGMAFLEAISFAVQNGWDKIIFESDSQILVESIHANQAGVSEFSYITNRIRASLSCINNFEVKFVRRQVNMVAHSLARAAISWASHHVLDMSPPCIDSMLINEKS